MKTLKKITALLSIFTVIISMNLSASNFNFADEAYIDDIPFDTQKVFNEVMVGGDKSQFDFEEEAYIDDIPFDTKCVTTRCLYESALKVDFSFTEEAYIDDIPFDTRQNVMQMAYKSAIEEVYNFEDEAYVDDIPLEILTSAKRNSSMELVFNKQANR